MNGGKLRHYVTINKPTPGTPDAFGGKPVTYPAFAKVWAMIEPQTGRQLEYARTFAASVTHKITTRYIAGVLPTFEINYKGRTFTIKAVVNELERNRELDFYCTEIVKT
jgi:SPP1 family predicted phage head-tail adaptor